MYLSAFRTPQRVKIAMITLSIIGSAFVFGGQEHQIVKNCKTDEDCLPGKPFCSSRKVCVKFDVDYCETHLCGIGDGDCDKDDKLGCEEGLVCGKNNCGDFHTALAKSDCCYNMTSSNASATSTAPLDTSKLKKISVGNEYTADQVGKCCYHDDKSSPKWQTIGCDHYTHDNVKCGRDCNHPDRVCPFYEMDGDVCRVGYKCCSGVQAGCAGLSEGDTCRDSSSRIEPQSQARNHFSGGRCRASDPCQGKVQHGVSALACEGASVLDSRFWPTVIWTALYSVLGLFCVISVVLSRLKKESRSNKVVDFDV